MESVDAEDVHEGLQIVHELAVGPAVGDVPAGPSVAPRIGQIDPERAREERPLGGPVVRPDRGRAVEEDQASGSRHRRRPARPGRSRHRARSRGPWARLGRLLLRPALGHHGPGLLDAQVAAPEIEQRVRMLLGIRQRVDPPDEQVVVADRDTVWTIVHSSVAIDPSMSGRPVSPGRHVAPQKRSRPGSRSAPAKQSEMCSWPSASTLTA